MNIYRIMIANGVVLIALGIYGYIVSSSPTALIAPAVGIVLIFLAFPTKNENRTAAHAAVILTLVSGVVFLVMGFLQSNLIVIIMAIFTLFALLLYISDFIRRKKEREDQSA